MSLPSIQLVDEAPCGFGTGLQGNALFVVYYDVMPNEILGRKRKSI